jgi:hypothetical protein
MPVKAGTPSILTIRRARDDGHDIYLDGAFITSVDYDESGVAVAVDLVTKLGEAFGAEVITEDVR